ncbi:hypothetical protein FGO68_gene12746 [Halteria grandinella]|uniref:Uncharacterized protein n=1 Tax=Halteria grandinella TaxID=5974 RepID=A0A8J8NH45_HALGN|nr:hypothetical protein FGO68_gene12746 [Halteria grandinella]
MISATIEFWLAMKAALAASRDINFNSQIPSSKLVHVSQILLQQQLQAIRLQLEVEREIKSFLKEIILIYSAHSSMPTLSAEIQRLSMSQLYQMHPEITM